MPPTLVDLLRVEGLGPKRVKQIYDSLGVETLEELTAAAAAGKLSALPGLGKKSEEKLRAAIEALQKHGDERTLLGDAWPVAQEILAALSEMPGVTKTAIAGSLRRMKESVGDVDLMVAAEDPQPVMDRFRTLDMVETVSAAGPTKSRSRPAQRTGRRPARFARGALGHAALLLHRQ